MLHGEGLRAPVLRSRMMGTRRDGWVAAHRCFEGHLMPLPVHVPFHCPAWLVASEGWLWCLCTPDEVSLGGDLDHACLQADGRHGSVARVSRVNALEPQGWPSIAAQEAWHLPWGPERPQNTWNLLMMRDLAVVLSYTHGSEVCRWCEMQGAYTYAYTYTHARMHI